jgi:DNA-binding MarR family transcriptional regulator
VVLIAQLARTVRRHFEATLGPVGFRQRHLVALSHLRDNGPTPQQVLAEILRMDASNLVGLLNELDDRGLIVRRRDPIDRRRHIVELSPHGEQVLKDVKRALKAIDDEVLGALSADDRETLHRILAEVTAGITAECAGGVVDDGC